MVTAFRYNSGFSGDAEKTYAELERIRKQHDGLLQPEAIVKAATRPSSALHRHFEWDDRKAAHAHRKRTARELVRAIVVVAENGNSGRVYANVSVVDDDDEEQSERGYVPIATMTRDQYQSALSLLRAKAVAIRYAIDELRVVADSAEKLSQVSACEAASEQLLAAAGV